MRRGATDPDRRLDRGELVYRWDLDKTYLRTEFDTARDLVRTAIESPRRKRSVPGAAALLREIRRAAPVGIHILSGSPEQMRLVLEAKLRLDGVEWDLLTLKPSLGQLLRGRFRFLRDQVGYKLGALLDSRVGLEPGVDEVMFGDDAEADAFIYSLYADLCAGRVDASTLQSVLEHAGVDDEDLLRIVRLSRRVPRREIARRIFIHLDRGSPSDAFGAFGPRVCAFHNYFQPALVLAADGALPVDAALRVGASLLDEHAFGPDALSASFDDVAGRGYVGEPLTLRLREAIARGGAAGAGRSAALARLGEHLARGRAAAPALPPAPERLDYVALFSRERARARREKARARARVRRRRP